MALCRDCRAHIKRLEGTDTWVVEGSVSPDGMAGEAWCATAPDGLHIAARQTTIEAARSGDLCEYCAWDVEAVYLIGGTMTCGDHAPRALSLHTDPAV